MRKLLFKHICPDFIYIDGYNVRLEKGHYKNYSLIGIPTKIKPIFRLYLKGLKNIFNHLKKDDKWYPRTTKINDLFSVKSKFDNIISQISVEEMVEMGRRNFILTYHENGTISYIMILD